MDKFNLDVSLWLHALVVIRLPAFTVTLTYALIQMVKKIAGKSTSRKSTSRSGACGSTREKLTRSRHIKE